MHRVAVLDEAAYAEQAAAALPTLGEGPALERIERLVHAVIEATAAQPDHARVLLDIWAAAPALEAVARGPARSMATVYDEYRDSIAELLRQARDNGEVAPGLDERYATVLVGAIEGSILQWLIDPQVPVRELAAFIVAAFVHGLRP